jgi:hypothetical protein
MREVRWSLAGMRRRAAMWLIAAWAFFSMAQAFAVCCMVPGGAVRTSTEATAVAHAHDAAAQDDCCETSEPSCPMALEETPPPAAPSTGLLAADQFQSAFPLVLHTAARPALAPRAERQARIAISQAPPDPIYLRLQRILI